MFLHLFRFIFKQLLEISPGSFRGHQRRQLGRIHVLPGFLGNEYIKVFKGDFACKILFQFCSEPGIFIPVVL